VTAYRDRREAGEYDPPESKSSSSTKSKAKSKAKSANAKSKATTRSSDLRGLQG
jgi:hypothetical protein